MAHLRLSIYSFTVSIIIIMLLSSMLYFILSQYYAISHCYLREHRHTVTRQHFIANCILLPVLASLVTMHSHSVIRN